MESETRTAGVGEWTRIRVDHKRTSRRWHRISDGASTVCGLVTTGRLVPGVPIPGSPGLDRCLICALSEA